LTRNRRLPLQGLSPWLEVDALHSRWEFVWLFLAEARRSLQPRLTTRQHGSGFGSGILLPNGSDQWLATHGQPSLRNDARESICIAWFRASHPDGAAVHSTPRNPTGATGPHAIAGRPPLAATRPIDEGDDGFTSGGPANTARFGRLDAASALSALQSRLPIRPSPPNAAPPPSLSQWRAELSSHVCGREEVGFHRRSRERAERLPSADRSQSTMNNTQDAVAILLQGFVRHLMAACWIAPSQRTLLDSPLRLQAPE
jgi:hypothetical protein